MKCLTCVISIVLITACEGRLSDQQRKELKEARKLQEIKVVNEAEITAQALAQGNAIFELLEEAGFDEQKIDSIEQTEYADIRWIEPGSTNAKWIENQLIEAYLVSAVTGGTQENVQKVGPDSLIYTKPVISNMPDGSVYVKGMWSIWLSKKQVVLSIE